MASSFTGPSLGKYYPQLALIEKRLGLILVAYSIPLCTYYNFSPGMLTLSGYTPNGSKVTYETPYCRAHLEFPELFDTHAPNL